MKSQRGAITLYVTVACLFILIVGIVAYVGTSSRQATQLAALNKLEEQYNNNETTAEDLYQQYDGGDIIPIYTPEQFAKVGSGEEVYVEQTGKFYVFGTDKTYMFYGVPEDLTFYLEQLTDEIKEQIKVEIGAGSTESGVTKGILTLTKSTNQLVTSLTITATAKTEDGIQIYVPPTGSETVYQTGITEISETYEVTRNGIYTFSVVDQNGKVTDAEIQITNIVTDGIGMVVNETEWTKNDVILTVTWPTGSEKGSKEIKIGDGSWTRYTGASTVLTISENATIKARVTDGNEEKKTNEIIIGNIDKAQPTLAATDGILTIEEGVSCDVTTLFEYDKNGLAPLTNVTYTLNDVAISNTNRLAPNATYAIDCTITKANGYELTATKNVQVNYAAGGNATAIANNPWGYYGKTVTNYECTNSAGAENWQIFHSDGENIYLISEDYLEQEYIPAGRNSSVIRKYSSGYYFDYIIADYDGIVNVRDETITDPKVHKWAEYEANYNSTDASNASKTIAYLLDTNVWSVYKNTSYADYAIGSPTVQLFFASLSDKYPEKRINVYVDESAYSFTNKDGEEIWPTSIQLVEDSLYTLDNGTQYILRLPSFYSSNSDYIYSSFGFREHRYCSHSRRLYSSLLCNL